ncbi:hypothetical protein [Sunxiuqinia sp. sy24]|uniref:hypothetical protein n=1 Tax=Sunxiuqinia sp. sy24 TaxID=3461495 RepID=UPI00404521DA
MIPAGNATKTHGKVIKPNGTTKNEPEMGHNPDFSISGWFFGHPPPFIAFLLGMLHFFGFAQKYIGG